MPESSLSLTNDDFRAEVEQFLRSVPSTDVTRIVKRGLANFYNPPPLPGQTASHRWSFMYRTAQLTTRVVVTSSTITYDHTDGTNERELTLASGTWPSWAADGTITITNQSFSVDQRISDTVLTLSEFDNPGADISSGTSYSLDTRDVRLPDDYAGIDGPITFGVPTSFPSIQITSEQRIRELRQDNFTLRTFRPYLGAIRPRNMPTSGASGVGERFELMLWPIPDAVYFLEVPYTIVPNTIGTSGTNVSPYPLGGGLHGETIMASIMAIAETYLDPAPRTFPKAADYMRRLASSVGLDAKVNVPEFFGYNGDGSDLRGFQKFDERRWVDVTVAGVLYSGL